MISNQDSFIANQHLEFQKSFDKVMFPIHRLIEAQYLSLPWPSQIQKIVVLTNVCGGRGDIAGAAKAISVLQRICPSLSFDWLISGGDQNRLFGQSFMLEKCERQLSPRRFFTSDPEDTEPAQFLLEGPVGSLQEISFIEDSILHRKIQGPRFCFLENASENTSSALFLCEQLQRLPDDFSPLARYTALHSSLFPSSVVATIGSLPMGLTPGSGIFLDREILSKPLSKGYCCPSYLLSMKDTSLQNDILSSMNALNGAIPDFDLYSMNSGYAHQPTSWGKFIDCVAIHEQTKNVVIVLNRQGELTALSEQEFIDSICSAERLAFLQGKGFGSIAFKGESSKVSLLDTPNGRSMTIIVRQQFLPYDMHRIQLASDRLLATGDNTAAEAWCARCILYLYEDVDNGGCKQKFLQQQVDLANTISPTLGKILALFGGDKRLPDPHLNAPLPQETMAELEHLLRDPNLSQNTIQFCHHITENYSFENVFIGALKRAAWTHCIPTLPFIEASAFDEKFRIDVLHSLDTFKAPTPIAAESLPLLKQRILTAVEQATSTASESYQ